MVPAGMTGFQGCLYNWRENMLAGIPGCSSLKDPLNGLLRFYFHFVLNKKSFEGYLMLWFVFSNTR